MARINIKQLEAFVQVADLGSFRGAAAVLKTTQPNISARITRLEEQLGQALIAYSGEREHLYRRNVNTHFPTH